MMFMMLLFWFLVIAGLILAVRWFLNDQKDRPGNDSALEILRQRNAGWMGLDRWLLPAFGTPWRAGTLFRGSKTVKAT